MALTVQLIEPYGYARAGLISMLQSEGLEPAPTDPTAAGAATHADGADVTIIGLSLEREAGLKAVRTVHNARPDHPVLLLLSPGETALGEQALREGARGGRADLPPVSSRCQRLNGFDDHGIPEVGHFVDRTIWTYPQYRD